MPSKIVTGVELAKILCVTPQTVRNWRKMAMIPAIVINRTTIRYDLSEVLNALKRRSRRPLGEAEAVQ